MTNKSETNKGILALVLLALLGSIMGIWVRFLGEHFQLYQQVTARSTAGFLLGLLLYRRRLRIHSILAAPRKDILLLLLRSFVLVIGIGLFTASVLSTKLANVNFISAIPMTALLGAIFLKEKLTRAKVVYIFLAFLGVILVSVNDFSQLFRWGYGETLALISTFFYSFSYIIRPWMSKKLNDQEIATTGTLFTTVFALIGSQLIGSGFREFFTIPPELFVIILLAGATFISLGFLWSYGFSRVSAIVANNLLVLGPVFGLLLGLVLYQEIPTFKELTGGSLIVVSAYLMNRLAN